MAKRTNFFQIYLTILGLTAFASASLYNKIENTEVGSILPGLTIYKSNAPNGCLLECNQLAECNLVTHSLPDRCDLYYVLKENTCINFYTKIPSISQTALYIKSRKLFNEPCKKSSQCMNEFGLFCLKGECKCLESL